MVGGGESFSTKSLNSSLSGATSLQLEVDLSLKILRLESELGHESLGSSRSQVTSPVK